MMHMNQVKETIDCICKVNFGKKIECASEHEVFFCVAQALMCYIADDWLQTAESYSQKKMAYYLSAEYLVGRALGNNLINLGIYKEMESVLGELGIKLNVVEEAEEDAGLGNGGLGRLAACFMEAAATMNLPLRGYGIRYSHGLFKQQLVDGKQIEIADDWLKGGDPWSVRREDLSVKVAYSDYAVMAVPYDVPIVGYGNSKVNTLRLWQCEPLENLDFMRFNAGDLEGAIWQKTAAENLSKVLYPNDQHDVGRTLRLRQQYFLVSASLQDIIRQHKQVHGNEMGDFYHWHAVQLNDTHPVLAIPEFIRLLMDEEGVCFERALEIAKKVFAYTNHTILQEALEKWDVSAFQTFFPRVLDMIKMIEEDTMKGLYSKGYTGDEVEPLRIIKGHEVHMANLAIHVCHTVNGVAELHTNILKNQELKVWYHMYPYKFQNKTNGITPRRWLCLANKELSQYITELLGSEDWKTNLALLKQLEAYKEDEVVLRQLMAIKGHNKKRLTDYLEEHEGIRVDETALFDVQVKRLHEYKRQLLGAFYILDLYYRLKEDPTLDIPKVVFIFGAKAFPGYKRAKAIIRYICAIAKLVNEDEAIGGRLKVVFITNYCVSYAEKLIPAADLSKQISTAGKEASGTGNMKFMLNGALTFGTYDGANVEIVRESGEENNFIFGLKVEDIELLAPQYHPRAYYDADVNLKRVMDTLVDGTFSDGGTGEFRDLYQGLIDGGDWQRPDPYFVLADFVAFKAKYEEVFKAYQDELRWAQMSLMNIANAGIFSSDRTIKAYSKEIWDIH